MKRNIFLPVAILYIELCTCSTILVAFFDADISERYAYLSILRKMKVVNTHK